jgi:hypothetical protein
MPCTETECHKSASLHLDGEAAAKTLRLWAGAAARWSVPRRSLLSARQQWRRAGRRPARSGAARVVRRRDAQGRAPRPRIVEGESVLPLAGRAAEPDRRRRDPEAVPRRRRDDSEADVRRRHDVAAVSSAGLVRPEPARFNIIAVAIAATALLAPRDTDRCGYLDSAGLLSWIIWQLTYWMIYGHSVRVGPDQYPHLYRLVRESAHRLGIPEPVVLVLQGHRLVEMFLAKRFTRTAG